MTSATPAASAATIGASTASTSLPAALSTVRGSSMIAAAIDTMTATKIGYWWCCAFARLVRNDCC